MHRGVQYFRGQDNKDPLICDISVVAREKAIVAGARGLLRPYHVPRASIKNWPREGKLKRKRSTRRSPNYELVGRESSWRVHRSLRSGRLKGKQAKTPCSKPLKKRNRTKASIKGASKKAKLLASAMSSARQPRYTLLLRLEKQNYLPFV